jgi:protein-L-isoaspartate(D-aspartate) O-methyltransferase
VDAAPYDAIHVGAAAPTLPEALVEQLASPGRMFIPVGTESQVILQVDKDEQGKVTQKELMGVMVRVSFVEVPLIYIQYHASFC